MNKVIVILLSCIFMASSAKATYMLIPMDETQKNHLKAYGIAYWVLQKDITINWLLNYEGGSFMFEANKNIENECNIRGVSYQIIANAQADAAFRWSNETLQSTHGQSLHLSETRRPASQIRRTHKRTPSQPDTDAPRPAKSPGSVSCP